MEALTGLHHRQQPLSPSLLYYCPSLSSSSTSSLFLSPPTSPPPSSFIRAASSSPPPSSSDPLLQDLQYPETKSPQFFNLLGKVPSFATITAASTFLFLGFCQNGFFIKPTSAIPTLVSIQEPLDEKSNVEDFLGDKPDQGQSILHLKLKEKVPVVHGFNKTKSVDDEAWQVLKEQVFSCSEELELVKVGFEKILEEDMDCNKVNQNRVLEYLETVDECKSLLKGIKVAMDRCERQNADTKHFLRFFSKIVARIRVLEGDMVGALKYFKELEQQ